MTCKNCYGKGYYSVYSGGEGGFTDFGEVRYITTKRPGIENIDCICRKEVKIKDISNGEKNYKEDTKKHDVGNKKKRHETLEYEEIWIIKEGLIMCLVAGYAFCFIMIIILFLQLILYSSPFTGK